MPGAEQRASERFNYEAPVVIENSQTGEYYDGSMYNYSRGGMYVELDHFLTPGSAIRIVVERAENSPFQNHCRARIVWCREIHGAVVLYDYGVGVQFDPAADPADCRKMFKIIEGGANGNNL